MKKPNKKDFRIFKYLKKKINNQLIKILLLKKLWRNRNKEK